jgi:hypothetical protein
MKQIGKNKLVLVLVLCFILAHTARAQQKEDSVKLPFAIANEKKLSDEDLKDKKEGVYVTGAPDISSDPINGFGYGGEGSIFFNGKRNDPFFPYTAYRAKLDFVVFNTTRDQREFFLRLDVPYILNTKWRLRAEGGYEVNPNLLYFGITANQSLQGLRYTDANGNVVNNASYTDYENNFLTGANKFYNGYNKKEAVFNISLEHSYMEGRLRALIGYEIAGVNMTSFSPNALIQQDFDNKRIFGLGSYNIAIAQVGLIYDTRDLEPDPNNGIFAEVTNEFSSQALGSALNFNKTFFHLNYYKKVFPGTFNRLVFAGRVAAGYTAGDAPFFEYQDQWSSEGSIEGLGGPTTLRGYKQSRFLGRTMSFNNFELRWRFAQTRIANQHLEFSAVPFFDVGGVWDGALSLQNNWRSSEGLGLRIAWNESTILRFDYAVSKEDQQFFFNLAHAF